MQPPHAVHRLAFTVLASLPLVVGACSSSSDDAPSGAETPAQAEPTLAASPPATMGEGPSRAGQASAETCPTAVPGATIRATDVEGGAALEVTTTGDVEAVRTRARAMAEHHQHHARDPEMAMQGHGRGSMGAPHGAGRGPMMHDGGGMMARAEIRVEDLDAGARIIFTPRDAGDLEAVRAHAHRLADRMASGNCPAMM